MHSSPAAPSRFGTTVVILTSASMTRGRRYLVAGRVQGVGFRYFAHAAAAKHQVTGFVRNLRDGRVEVRAEGTAASLAAFELELRTGPAGARVDRMHAEDEPSTGCEQFEIRETA